MKYSYLFLVGFICLSACKKNNPTKQINDRNFYMGFSTWSFGPTLEDVNETYNFVSNNGDIYSEHLDLKIPWSAWINGTELPIEFTNEINGRVARKPIGANLLLSVSFLNSDRSDIMEDFDHNKPEYLQLNDSGIVNAYLSHLYYLVDKFEPNYLVYSIESNELLVNNPTLWPAFRSLMDSVGFELKEKYPNLKMSESVTLHGWYKADQGDDYIKEVDKIANSGDFTAISFYPFFKGLHTHNEFQKAFDFLHNRTNLPIAFVETNHLGEDLFIENLSLDIKGNENEQRDYLETLLINANKENYEFVIWWAYRDYDALWKTFPAEIKDLGQIWRDTGLKDEAGEDRKSMKVWREIFAK